MPALTLVQTKGEDNLSCLLCGRAPATCPHMYVPTLMFRSPGSDGLSGRRATMRSVFPASRETLSVRVTLFETAP